MAVPNMHRGCVCVCVQTCIGDVCVCVHVCVVPDGGKREVRGVAPAGSGSIMREVSTRTSRRECIGRYPASARSTEHAQWIRRKRPYKQYSIRVQQTREKSWDTTLCQYPVPGIA
eukprot:3510911-Rhodomonas_salina.5